MILYELNAEVREVLAFLEMLQVSHSVPAVIEYVLFLTKPFKETLGLFVLFPFLLN